MSRVLGVSHGGYYAAQGRPGSRRVLENERLSGLIRQSFAGSDRTYGSPRVWRDLVDWGERCSKHRVARLMRQAGLVARSPRRRRPVDGGERPAHATAPNVLDRAFGAAAPNRKWAADFTYLDTAEGWLYVAVVIDLYSRKVVGWSMQASMGDRRAVDGDLAARQASGAAAPLGSGQPIHGGGLPAAARLAEHHLQHEQARPLLG
jgi:putative transposase